MRDYFSYLYNLLLMDIKGEESNPAFLESTYQLKFKLIFQFHTTSLLTEPIWYKSTLFLIDAINFRP